MLSRPCSTAVRHAVKIEPAEVAAALAQLPSFLVPSFTQSCPNPSRPLARRKLHTVSRTPPASAPSRDLASLPLRQPLLPSPRLYSAAAARTTQRIQHDSEVDEQVRNLSARSNLDRKGKGKAKDVAETGDKFAQEVQEEEEDAYDEEAGSHKASAQEVEYRRQLIRLVGDLPLKPSRKDLLEVRKQIKARDGLGYPRPVMKLVSIAIGQNYHDLALRLLDESTDIILSRATSSPKRVVWLYIDVIRRLGKLRRWDFVVDATNQALKKGLVSSPLLHNRMRGLNRRSRFVDTIETFRLYDEHGIPPDGPAYDEVIEAHLLNADLSTAQAVLAEKGERGFRTTAQTCLTLFDGMALYGGNKVMEEKVLADADKESLEKGSAVRQDVRVLNKIMSVRAGRDAARDALAMLEYYDLSRYPEGLFDRFRRLALPSPDSKPSASALSPNQHWRPSPDAATLVTLTSLALRQRRPDLASDLLSSTSGRSHQLNDHLAASIVRILITEGAIVDAEEFVFALPHGSARFRDFTYLAFQPNSFVYESLLSGILRFRGLVGVNDCFRRMTEAKLPPLKVTEGLAKALVDYLALEKMEKLGVSGSLLLKVKRITAGRTKPTRENLETLLKAAWMSERLSLNEWTKLRRSIENEFPIPAKDEGIKPPQRPLPPIAQILARSKFDSNSSARRIRSLARIRDSLTDRNIRHSAGTAVHTLRNDHLIRFISAKWDYLQAQVLDLGVRPTYEHFTVLIRAYLHLGDIKGAVLALRYALSEAKIEPHVALYSTMISGLSRLGRPDLALTMYDELRETRGLEPDRQLFAALAMSCSRMRDLDGLDRVLHEVKEVVNNPLPCKNVDPALLAQAQIQGQSRRKLKSAETDQKKEPEEEEELNNDGRRTLFYDPRLDPVFLTIYYRTLNILGRHDEAQRVMRDSLNRGLVPDRIVWEVLDRTGTWIKWKSNKDKRDGTPIDRARTKTSWEKNFRRVREMMRKAKRSERDDELKAIERYWEKAERDDVDEREWAKFFRDTSSRGSKKQAESERRI